MSLRIVSCHYWSHLKYFLVISKKTKRASIGFKRTSIHGFWWHREDRIESYYCYNYTYAVMHWPVPPPPPPPRGQLFVCTSSSGGFSSLYLPSTRGDGTFFLYLKWIVPWDCLLVPLPASQFTRKSLCGGSLKASSPQWIPIFIHIRYSDDEKLYSRHNCL